MSSLKSPRTARSRTQGKLIVFLDMNAWINLAESKEPKIVELQKLLCTLVSNEEAIFPLADFTIHELFKQHVDSALRVGAIMDRLSQGVSFAPRDAIQRQEAVKYINSWLAPYLDLSLQPGDIFAPVGVHFVGGSLTEELPPHKPKMVPWSLAQDALCHLSDRQRGFELSLCDCIEHQAVYLPVIERATHKEEWEKVIKDRMAFAGKSWEKHRRIEEEFVIRKRVLPPISQLFRALRSAHDEQPSLAPLLESAAANIHSAVESRSRDKYGGLAKEIRLSAKTIQAEIDTLTASGLDPNRRHKLSDSYDIELLIAPRVHSHILVADDKWIRSLMNERLRTPGLLYVDKLAKLQDGIDALLSTGQAF